MLVRMAMQDDKLSVLLRTLLLLSYAVFWGGLTFYTGFVVRISHDVLSDPMDGGLITQRVTGLLQWLGVVTAVMMFGNAWRVRRACTRRFSILVGCCVLLAASLFGLFVVHGDLDRVISIEEAAVIDRESFVVGHRRYNQLTTVEWISTLVYLPVVISAWRVHDRKPGE